MQIVCVVQVLLESSFARWGVSDSTEIHELAPDFLRPAAAVMGEKRKIGTRLAGLPDAAFPART